MRQNLKAYKQVNVNSTILDANPHQLVLMMFDGMLQGVAVAKGAIERKDYLLKSESLTKATNILQALRQSLDFDVEPEVSNNFDVTYEYCIQRIADASVLLDCTILDEVVSLIKPIRDAWFDMPEQQKQEGLEAVAKKREALQGV